uniref:Uncharacterized protein n=1 Tax=Myoviridae sp. ctzS633 TaxID=2825212 RepID=A0A8S5PUJ3_9CAUD|nr:MAG TPA: hypothetical protein [Myoviridae sp. ctzS633]
MGAICTDICILLRGYINKYYLFIYPLKRIEISPIKRI